MIAGPIDILFTRKTEFQSGGIEISFGRSLNCALITICNETGDSLVAGLELNVAETIAKDLNRIIAKMRRGQLRR